MQSLCLMSSANHVFDSAKRARQQKNITFEPRTRSIVFPARLILALLSLIIAADRPAFAGCEAIGVCNKTLYLRYKSGESAWTGDNKAYIGKNGNIYMTGTAGTEVTDKVGGGFVGTSCSEQGSETLQVCPGTDTCPYTAKNEAQHYFSTTTKIRCTVIYDSEGFILRSERNSVTNQQMTLGENGRSEYQTVKQQGSSEERYYVRGDDCSVTGRGTSHLSSNNTWGAPMNNTNKTSWHSISCRILNGRNL